MMTSANNNNAEMKLPLSLASSAKSNRRSFLSSSVNVAGAGLLSFAVITQRPRDANSADAPPSVMPAVGTKAPEFKLPNSKGDGSTTTLQSLTKNNKWTVLYFYPGAFTQGCTLEAKGFQRDIEKYQALDTQIVGVSVDPVEKNASFCSQFGLDFYMLSDVGGRVSKTYGSALAVPGFGTFSNRQTYIIDPKGNLRWVFTDVESRVPRHSAEVLEKLNELTTTA